MELNYEILEKLSTKYGDAFYLVDSSVFRKNYEELLAAFCKIYPNTRIAYSYKTNYMPIGKNCQPMSADYLVKFM